MFNTCTDTDKNLILKSGAVIAVVASLGLVMVSDQRPAQIDIGEDAILSVGLRLNQYAPITRLPSWLQLPDRSTAASLPMPTATECISDHCHRAGRSNGISAHFFWQMAISWRSYGRPCRFPASAA